MQCSCNIDLGQNWKILNLDEYKYDRYVITMLSTLKGMQSICVYYIIFQNLQAKSKGSICLLYK